MPKSLTAFECVCLIALRLRSYPMKEMLELCLFRLRFFGYGNGARYVYHGKKREYESLNESREEVKVERKNRGDTCLKIGNGSENSGQPAEERR